jgi:hypothetical protein
MSNRTLTLIDPHVCLMLTLKKSNSQSINPYSFKLGKNMLKQALVVSAKCSNK